MVAFRSVTCCVFLLFSITAWSAELSLALTDDATVTGNRASSNYGALTTIVIHDFGPKQGLVKFDSSGLSGETVQSATLSLYLNAITGSGTVTVHPITSTWDEASVTWNTLPSYETTAVSSASLTNSNVGSFVTFDVTDTVQRWANGQLEPNGFLLQTTEAVRVTFQSKENSGGNPPSLNVVIDDVSPPPTTGIGTPPTILDLSSGAIVIDEPGHYILDRNWEVDGLPNNSVIIDMQANATLDFQGFTIDTNVFGGTVVQISDGGGVVKNGRIITGAGNISTPIHSIGTAVVHDMHIYGDPDLASIRIDGPTGQITGSVIQLGYIYMAGRGGRIESNEVSCYDDICLAATGGHTTITNNTFHSDLTWPFVVSLEGDNYVFSDNIVGSYEGGICILVTGNGSLLAGNTLRGYPSKGVQIDGSGNVLKDNILLPSRLPNDPVTFPAPVGIEFLQDGNIYRDNQMSAIVPFELNATTQTDLGGNVGY
jgi:hypothetical protein